MTLRLLKPIQFFPNAVHEHLFHLTVINLNGEEIVTIQLHIMFEFLLSPSSIALLSEINLSFIPDRTGPLQLSDVSYNQLL